MNPRKTQAVGAWGAEPCHHGIGIHDALYHKEYPDALLGGEKLISLHQERRGASTHY